jgi:hypothetical protein
MGGSIFKYVDVIACNFTIIESHPFKEGDVFFQQMYVQKRKKKLTKKEQKRK